MPLALWSVSPWRQMIRVRPSLVASTSGGEVDGRTVLPQPLELVVVPFLLVLDVHDDVGEVDQDPTAVTLTFAAHRFDAQLAKPVLDAFDDRADLSVVGSRRQHEDVGEGELFTDVNGDDLAGQLVLGSCSGSLGEGNGGLRGRSAAPLAAWRCG